MSVPPSPWWLHDAARNGDISEVRELLDAGVPVDYEYGLYGTALHEAAAFGHTQIATLLLDRGADVNGAGYDGFTPLHYAVRRQGGNLELATLLFDRGADVTAKDDDGWTPIHRAVLAERHELVALLASRGEAMEFSLAKAEDRLAAAEVEIIRAALTRRP